MGDIYMSIKYIYRLVEYSITMHARQKLINSCDNSLGIKFKIHDIPEIITEHKSQ